MPPSFKLDENMPKAAVQRLSAAGMDTSSVVLQRMSGSPDPRVASVSASEGRVLVTLDLDFSDIRTYPPGSGPGIVVFRPDNQDVASVLVLVEALLALLDTNEIAGALWIIEPGKVRVRGASPQSGR